LGKAVGSEIDEVRYYAVWTLGRIGPDARATVPAILKALGDVEDEVRRKAAFALGQIGADGEKVIPALINAFRDDNPEVREAAAVATATFGKSAVPTLRKTLKELPFPFFLHAVDALGEMGVAGAEAIPDLCALLRDANGGFAHHLQTALEKLGKTAIPRLTKAVKDGNADVRWYLLEIATKIGEKATPTLFAGLECDDPGTRAYAAGKLGELATVGFRDPDLIEALGKLLGDEGIWTRQTA